MSPDATSVDQPAAGVSAPAESTPAASQAPQPQKTAAAFADFDAVFGGGSSENGSSADVQAATNGAPSNEATAGTGATPDDDEDEATAEATTATAEGQPPAEKKLSRTARIHAEWEAKVQQVEAEKQEATARAEALQQQLDEASGKVSEAEQQRRATQAAFTEAFGDDAEYERLRRINDTSHVTGTYLSNEDAEKLARWTTTRTHAEPLQQRYLADARQIVERANEDARATVERAGQQFQQYIAAETISRVERHGLDPEVVKTAEYGGLLDHAVAVTEKRLTDKHTAEIKDRDDKISQLEADLRAAEHAGLADRTELLPGGNSADVRVTARRVFDPKAPLDQAWDAAFGQRPQSVR